MKTFKFWNALITVSLLFTCELYSQVGINTDGSMPDNTSILDMKSTSKGVLIPRLTYQQIMSIQSPANGLQVFCLDDGKLYLFVAAAGVWKEVAYGSGTITPWTCGMTMTINHSSSGGVSPVTKTVQYGTVTNLPGEPAKCWITRNFGASIQAVTVDDTSEAASGWYFQFNRKQGYRFIGTTRTPNTVWVFAINENSDWTAVNDPCVNDMGYGWRLPTYDEWANVDASGNWTDWTGPWLSPLKIHASGFLNQNDGWVALRGVFGGYWSSSQISLTLGLNMDFNSGNSTPNMNDKAYGFAIRCIKDAP